MEGHHFFKLLLHSLYLWGGGPSISLSCFPILKTRKMAHGISCSVSASAAPKSPFPGPSPIESFSGSIVSGQHRERSTKGVHLIVGKLSAESKIHNFNVHVSIKEHILWLQVPMYDVSLCGNTIHRILAVGKCLWLHYSFRGFFLQNVE